MEPILHLIIPLLIILVLFPKLDKKLVVMLSLLAFTPDFDIFIQGWHRILFHNIFFVILVSLLIYSRLGKQAGYITFYFVSSHLILDLAKEGVAILWPLFDKTVYITSEITRGIYFPAAYNFEIGTVPIEEVRTYMTSEAAKSYYLMTEGTQILMLIIILVLVKYLILNNYRKSK